jgi:mono/diheme cytochrome c family protein
MVRALPNCVWAAFALIAAWGCASQLPVPSPADARRAEALWPGTTQTDLADGRELFINRCASCHTLPMPQQFKQAAWPGFVDEMAEVARLDQPERAKLTRYLVLMAPP